MEKWRADNVELDSRVERRFGQCDHDSIENVLYGAVGMVLAISHQRLELARQNCGLGLARRLSDLIRILRVVRFDRFLSKFAAWANCSWVRSAVNCTRQGNILGPMSLVREVDHGDQ